ncbi:MAG: hypothetical protein GY913_09405 [Proteobacteria bacterium]|nr:hypothetical protein [Pseudomonadota bacterium]MCP4917129.1 hypothetical protein [Pseudomonadota bacterium]
MVLSTAGTLSLCDGTYYVNLDIQADVDIAGALGDETAVVLDGAAYGTVIAIETDGIAVSVADLTIQNGFADVNGYGGASLGGGGIACDGLSAVTADNVVLDQNYGYVGGAVALNTCPGVFTDVTMSNNTASYAGALSLTDTTAELYDSFVESNAVIGNAGAFYIIAHNGTGSDLYLEDTSVADNTADSGIAQALIHTSSTLECIGSTGTSGLGFTGHDDSIYGAQYGSYSGAVLDVTDCDFDATDNTDIYWQGRRFDGLGDDETFVCNDSGCGDAEEVEIGGTVSSTYNTSLGIFGDIVLADEDTTLSSFEVYAQAGEASCDLDYHVLSASSGSATSWTVEWSSTGNELSETAGWHDSGTVDLDVTSGTYYALVWAADCDNNYYYDTAGLSTDGGFGTVTGYMYKAYEEVSGTLSSPSTSTSYMGPFGTRIVTGTAW